MNIVVFEQFRFRQTAYEISQTVVQKFRKQNKVMDIFLVEQVRGLGPEQREFGKTVLYLIMINIILISYIITYYYY